MTQRIKIKRSNSATNPANLKEGELAYIHSNNTAGNLYIGRPGTGDANTGIASSLDIVGGLIDHNKLAGIEANADVTDTTNVTSAGAAMLTGATFTGDVNIADDEELRFGTSNDLKIFHKSNENSSYIREQGTGDLYIQGNDLYLTNTDSAKYLLGVSGGETRIYYDGSEKLNTKDTGIEVTGDVTATGTLATGGFTLSSTDGTNGQALVTDGSGNVAFGDVTVDVSGKADLSGDTFTGDVLFNDGVKAKFGTDSDLLIYHNDGEPSVIEDAGELGLVMKTNGNMFAVVSDTNESMITALPDTAVTLYFDNNAKLATTTNGINVTGNIVVSSTVDGRDVATDGAKLDGIESSADVTDTINVTAAGALMDSEVTNLAQVKAFDSSDYLTAHQDITGKADLSGADFTGAVGIADGERLNFGTSNDLTLYHDDNTGSSFIKETGTGSFAIQGNNLVLSDIDASKYLFGISGGETRIYYNGDTKLATQDAGVGVTGNVTATGTLATGGFTLSSTDGTNGQALVTDGSGNVAFGDVTVDVSGKADLSGATFTGDVVVNGDFTASGEVNLGAAAADTTVKGDLIVDGDLTVNGTTTTINTETIELADNIIELNSNVTGTAAIGTAGLNAGLTVNRGTGINTYNSEFRWSETNGDWTVTEASSTTHALLHTGNFEEKITELDGGTFS